MDTICCHHPLNGVPVRVLDHAGGVLAVLRLHAGPLKRPLKTTSAAARSLAGTGLRVWTVCHHTLARAARAANIDCPLEEWPESPRIVACRRRRSFVQVGRLPVHMLVARTDSTPEQVRPAPDQRDGMQVDHTGSIISLVARLYPFLFGEKKQGDGVKMSRHV